MGEVDTAKMTRVKKVDDGSVHQIMTAITDTTIKGIVKTANELSIKREDIVSLIKENGQFVLIYYK